VIYLFLTVCALLAFLGWTQWLHARQVKTLTNIVIARTPGEARMLNAPAPKPRKRTEQELELEALYAEFDPVGM
jgi:hypothetical protein